MTLTLGQLVVSNAAMSCYPPPFPTAKRFLIFTVVMWQGAGILAAQKITSFSLTPEAGHLRAAFQGTWEPGTAYIIEDSPDMITWNQVSPVMHPAQSLLNWSHLQYTFPSWADALLSETVLAVRNTRWFYRVRKLPPADAAPQVVPTTPMGRLVQAGGANSPLTYITHAHWTIKMDQSTITVTDPGGKATYQHWGHPHENLNGKHTKDWLGTHRTMILPGGAMITMKATGPHGVVEAVSIYDVDQTHKLNMTNNTVAMSVPLVRVGEAAEPDGETMRFWHIGRGCFYAENIYTQETAGDGTSIPQEEIPLGTTGGEASPTQVNDLYDDKRLGHT